MGDVTSTVGREACHAARDSYYACKADAAAAPGTAPAAPAAPENPCGKLRKEYEALCMKSWVKYWDERVRRGLPLRVGQQ